MPTVCQAQKESGIIDAIWRGYLPGWGVSGYTWAHTSLLKGTDVKSGCISSLGDKKADPSLGLGLSGMDQSPPQPHHTRHPWTSSILSSPTWYRPRNCRSLWSPYNPRKSELFSVLVTHSPYWLYPLGIGLVSRGQFWVGPVMEDTTDSWDMSGTWNGHRILTKRLTDQREGSYFWRLAFIRLSTKSLQMYGQRQTKIQEKCMLYVGKKEIQGVHPNDVGTINYHLHQGRKFHLPKYLK